MIPISDLKAALNANPEPVCAGSSIDCLLQRQPGLVERERNYRVYLPKGYDGSRSLPVVFVLHGCRQDHHDIQSITGFDQIADREHFIVVYPFVTSHTGLRTQNCWGWWMSGERQRNKGEIGDIHQILSAVIRNYAVDQSRLHICGLSAGAAMSVVALATYSDIWASGASVAGIPFGESAQAVKFANHIPVKCKSVKSLVGKLEKALVSQAPPLLIIQSESDNQVGRKLAETLRDTWLQVSALQPHSAQLHRGFTKNMDWSFDQFSGKQPGENVSYLLLNSDFHGWIGGLQGQYSLTQGPNISELIWAFFKAPATPTTTTTPTTTPAIPG